MSRFRVWLTSQKQDDSSRVPGPLFATLSAIFVVSPTGKEYSAVATDLEQQEDAAEDACGLPGSVTAREGG